MARRRKIKEKAFNIGKKLFPVAKGLSAPVAFLEQVSAKDRQVLGSAFTNAPTTQKLKILANIVTGRVTGINFFSNEYQAPQTINPAGLINKWTNAGGIMLVYKVLGRGLNKTAGMQIAPATDKIGSIGKQFLIGGGIGGFFDDPAVSSNGSKQQGTRHLSPQSTPMLQRSSNSFGSSGVDSTESGM